jgi:hypothetical protein
MDDLDMAKVHDAVRAGIPDFRSSSSITLHSMI